MNKQQALEKKVIKFLLDSHDKSLINDLNEIIQLIGKKIIKNYVFNDISVKQILGISFENCEFSNCEFIDNDIINFISCKLTNCKFENNHIVNTRDTSKIQNEFNNCEFLLDKPNTFGTQHLNFDMSFINNCKFRGTTIIKRDYCNYLSVHENSKIQNCEIILIDKIYCTNTQIDKVEIFYNQKLFHYDVMDCKINKVNLTRIIQAKKQ